MRALLDVNALIALLDEEHVHHRLIVEWLSRAEHLVHGFATCAITELGLIRVMSSKGYFKPVAPEVIVTQLNRMTRKGHRYLDIPAPVASAVRWVKTTSRQSTDATLLCTAVTHGCRLITFDAGITLQNVASAKHQHLVIIDADKDG